MSPAEEMRCWRCGQVKSAHLFTPYAMEQHAKGRVVCCRLCWSGIHGSAEFGKRYKGGANGPIFEAIDESIKSRSERMKLIKQADERRLIEARRLRLEAKQ